MGYHVLTSGSCGGESVQTIQECNAAATFLGFADRIAMNDGQNPGYTCAQMPITSLPSPPSVTLKHLETHAPPKMPPPLAQS